MDGSILLFIQDNIRNPVLNPVMKGLSFLGNKGIFWVILTLVLLIFAKTRKAGLASVIAILLTFIFNDLFLKNTVARIRPYEVIEGLTIIVAKENSYSFASGHAAIAFASSVSMFRWLPRKASVCLVVLAALIALSRLYVGVHYPTDVLAGTVIGIVFGLIASFAVKKITERKANGGSAA